MRIKDQAHKNRVVLTLSSVILGVVVFFVSQTHTFAGVVLILSAFIASVWRIDDRLTHIAGSIYIASAALVIWQWDVLVWVYDLTLGFVFQLLGSLYEMLGALVNLEIAALLFAFWGFLVLVLKYLLAFVLKSLPGGFFRLFTIVPAKKVLTLAYKKVSIIKTYLDRFVGYTRGVLRRYWRWLRTQDLFIVIYAGLPVGILIELHPSHETPTYHF